MTWHPPAELAIDRADQWVSLSGRRLLRRRGNGPLHLLILNRPRAGPVGLPDAADSRK